MQVQKMTVMKSSDNTSSLRKCWQKFELFLSVLSLCTPCSPRLSDCNVPWLYSHALCWKHSPPKDGVEGTKKPVFGVNVIIVMAKKTGISDRAYLSMENTIPKCVCVHVFELG